MSYYDITPSLKISIIQNLLVVDTKYSAKCTCLLVINNQFSIKILLVRLVEKIGTRIQENLQQFNIHEN